MELDTALAGNTGRDGAPPGAACPLPARDPLRGVRRSRRRRSTSPPGATREMVLLSREHASATTWANFDATLKTLRHEALRGRPARRGHVAQGPNSSPWTWRRGRQKNCSSKHVGMDAPVIGHTAQVAAMARTCAECSGRAWIPTTSKPRPGCTTSAGRRPTGCGILSRASGWPSRRGAPRLRASLPEPLHQGIHGRTSCRSAWSSRPRCGRPAISTPSRPRRSSSPWRTSWRSADRRGTFEERHDDLARRYGESEFFDLTHAAARRIRAEFEARTGHGPVRFAAVMKAYKEAIAAVAKAAGLDEASGAAERHDPEGTRPRGPDAALLPARQTAPRGGAKGRRRLCGKRAAGLAPRPTGPFVNFRIHRGGVHRGQTLFAIDEGFGGSDEGAGKSIVIDYGSPNIAKPLLFHHLRSAAIGQALCNLFRHRGYEVIGLNFLGDVGTAFGKLMVGITDLGEADDAATLNERYVAAVEDVFRRSRRRWTRRAPGPSGSRTATRRRHASLGGRSPDLARRIRRGVRPPRRRAHRRRRRADVCRAGQRAGRRSFGLSGKAEVSDGAVVIRPDGEEGDAFLIRKGDGATLYSTRDIAAARDRFERFGFFAVAVRRGRGAVASLQDAVWRASPRSGTSWSDRCRHVSFGQVLMGGKRTATREGRGVLLLDVLRDGIERAKKIMEEKNADLADPDTVARAVGVGAVVFSDVGFPVRRRTSTSTGTRS